MECSGWWFLSCLRDTLWRTGVSLRVVLERFVADESAQLQCTVVYRRTEGLQEWFRVDALSPHFLKRAPSVCLFKILWNTNTISTEVELYLYLKEVADAKEDILMWKGLLCWSRKEEYGISACRSDAVFWQQRCDLFMVLKWSLQPAKSWTTGFSRLLLLLVMRVLPFDGSSEESVLW